HLDDEAVTQAQEDEGENGQAKGAEGTAPPEFGDLVIELLRALANLDGESEQQDVERPDRRDGDDSDQDPGDEGEEVHGGPPAREEQGRPGDRPAWNKGGGENGSLSLAGITRIRSQGLLSARRAADTPSDTVGIVRVGRWMSNEFAQDSEWRA